MLQDFFILYEEVLPNALPVLLGAIGSGSLLKFLQRSRQSTTPLLEAAIETALLLSFGGRTKEQHEEELRLSLRQINAMKHVNQRRRHRNSYESSSSDESDGDEQESKHEFVDNDKAISLKRFEEAYETMKRQHELQQQRGIQILLPHMGILLHSMELLLNARRDAGILTKSGDAHSATLADRASEGGKAADANDSAQAFLHRRKRAQLVGFKELQLLTRLAAYACADKDSFKELPKAQNELAHHSETGSIPTAAKLIRLLLLSLPLRVRSGGAAARQQLTLVAIQGLLPALASWRRTLGSSNDSYERSSEMRRLLRGLYASCCSLLEAAEDLQCRAEASKLLLATELAACGCVLKEQFLSEQVRGFALKEISACWDAEGTGNLEASPVSWLAPGGPLNKCLLDNALPSLLVDRIEPASAILAGSSELAAAWRICVGLVMVCANFLKTGSRSPPEEQRPDVDMQVSVLLALVENHLDPPALAQGTKDSAAETQTSDSQAHVQIAGGEEKGNIRKLSEDAVKQNEARITRREKCLQEDNGIGRGQARGGQACDVGRLNLHASAFEPVVRHVLYLLSECSDDITLQHVALAIIRKAAVSLGAAASAAATRRTVVQFSGSQHQNEAQGAAESDWAFAVEMQRHIMKSIIPHLHRLLRSMKEQCQQMALRAFDALVRTLGPAGPLLPPPQAAVADDDESISALFISESDEKQRNMRLHLDLYPLLAATQLTPAIKEAAALAQQLVASGQTGRAATAAARAAQLEALAGEQQASEREGGGDILVDLLHMQKHRRARGIQLLTKAASAGKLCPNTLKHFCVPLAIWAILQDSDAGGQVGKQKGSKASSQHFKGRTEAFSQQMADHGVACLAKCCTQLPLKICIQTLRQLVTHLGKTPQREAFIHRAIAATLKAFPFGLTDAVHQTLAQPRITDEQRQGNTNKCLASVCGSKEMEALVQDTKQIQQPEADVPSGTGRKEVGSSEDTVDDGSTLDQINASSMTAQMR